MTVDDAASDKHIRAHDQGLVDASTPPPFPPSCSQHVLNEEKPGCLLKKEVERVNMNALGDDHVSFSARQLAASPDGRLLLVSTDGPRILLLRTQGAPLSFPLSTPPCSSCSYAQCKRSAQWAAHPALPQWMGAQGPLRGVLVLFFPLRRHLAL